MWVYETGSYRLALLTSIPLEIAFASSLLSEKDIEQQPLASHHGQVNCKPSQLNAISTARLCQSTTLHLHLHSKLLNLNSSLPCWIIGSAMARLKVLKPCKRAPKAIGILAWYCGGTWTIHPAPFVPSNPYVLSGTCHCK